MTQRKGEDFPERITVLSKDFMPAAMEYHRRAMADKGYRLDGSITPRKFLLIDGLGAPKELFNGETYFAVTFVRDKTADAKD